MRFLEVVESVFFPRTLRDRKPHWSTRFRSEPPRVFHSVRDPVRRIPESLPKPSGVVLLSFTPRATTNGKAKEIIMCLMELSGTMSRQTLKGVRISPSQLDSQPKSYNPEFSDFPEEPQRYSYFQRRVGVAAVTDTAGHGQAISLLSKKMKSCWRQDADSNPWSALSHVVFKYSGSRCYLESSHLVWRCRRFIAPVETFLCPTHCPSGTKRYMRSFFSEAHELTHNKTLVLHHGSFRKTAVVPRLLYIRRTTG